MKILNKDEMKQFADDIFMEETEAHEVVDIFVKIKTGKINTIKIASSLDSVDDYINEWEEHWHRETNWNEFYEYEKQYFGDGDEDYNKISSPEELEDYAKDSYAFELSTGLIVVFC